MKLSEILRIKVVEEYGEIRNPDDSRLREGARWALDTVTPQVAIDFHEWCETSREAYDYCRHNRIEPKMNGSHEAKIRQQYKELFKLFLKQYKICATDQDTSLH